MSNYNQNANEAEKQLKNISPTMCYAKWTQVSIHLTNGMTHSCYHPPLHKIDIKEISSDPKSLHNTVQKKQERAQMLAGKRPDGCSYCWKIEDVGGRSDRIYRSGEYWAQNARKDIFEALDTGNVNPRYVEVNFNQACNLKCMYCSPHLSTTWEDEIIKHGPYDIINSDGTESKHNDIEYLEKDGFMPLKVRQDENPYLIAFWKWWPELYKSLEVFRITGGEPLMDVNTFKVLDYIYENPNAWLEVSITTNMSPPKKELIIKFIDKLKKLEQIQIWQNKERFNPGSGNHWYVNMSIKNFSLFVSLDSVGDKSEYIRSGLNYNELQENVLTYLRETKNTTLTFINTFNVLSVTSLTDFLKYILELRTTFSKEAQGTTYIPIYDPYHKHDDYVINPKQRIWFDVPLLQNPAWQSITILPESFDRYIEEAIIFMKHNSNVDNYDGFYDFEIEKVERNLKILQETRTNSIIDKRNFFNYYKQYDLRKSISFLEIFPEYEEFYNSCKLNV